MEEVREELLRLIAEDDAVRERLAGEGSLFEGYHPEMEAVHRRNAARLREIVAQVGWPKRSLVGEDGAAAAWRILQHAIGEPDFMRGSLAMLLPLAEVGEVDPAHVAMLEDRICVNEGRLQRYGTQLDWNESGTAMVPTNGVENPEGVDARRKAVGLPPMRWEVEPPEDEPPPSNPKARRQAMEDWARRTGWR